MSYLENGEYVPDFCSICKHIPCECIERSLAWMIDKALGLNPTTEETNGLNQSNRQANQSTEPTQGHDS